MFAVKSTLAAGLAWQIVSTLFGVEAAALAVVSAVIVVQVTSWQTVRKSIERIIGVIIGVSLAVLVAHLLGLNFWTITLIIFFAQIIGMFLQNRGQYLATQIPISAALALVLGATGSYPLLRVFGTLVGSLIGTGISLLFSPPIYVFRTQDAVAELTTRVADAIPKLAAALTVQLSAAESSAVYTSMRELEDYVHTTEQTYSLGMDSTRLNPWARHTRRLLVDYPDMLQALDRLVRQMRRIAYTINEPEPPWSELARDQDWAHDYARLLEEMASTLRSIVVYIHSSATPQSNHLPDKENLRTQVEHAQQQLHSWQEQLGQAAKQFEAQTATDASPPSISNGYRIAIRGAILTDLRRMLDEVHDIVALTA